MRISPRNRSFNQGFTLVEVIISLAIFGVLIGGVIGALPWGIEKSDSVRDRNTAQALVDGVQIELERLGFSVVEWGTRRLEGLYRVSGEPEDIENGTIRKLILVASKNGQRISLERVVETEQIRKSGKLETMDEHEDVSNAITFGGRVDFEVSDGHPVSLEGFSSSVEDEIALASNRWVDPEDRYFAIICSQFSRFPDKSGPESRHFHHPSNGYLALNVEVQWPYKVPGNQQDTIRVVEEKYRSNFSFPLAIAR